MFQYNPPCLLVLDLLRPVPVQGYPTDNGTQMQPPPHPQLNMPVSTQQISVIRPLTLAAALHEGWALDAAEFPWPLQFCTLYLVFQLGLMAFLKHDLKL